MLEIGSLLDGKYKILNKIGQGGMSVVYLAMNEKANKQWAIKEVRKDGVLDDESVKQGLVAEKDILKKLNHPNLPSIVDVIDKEDSLLIIMDYIEGNSLKKALEEYGAQPQENVIQWAKQLCDVLVYLHSRTPPIIYRDMKPDNIMLKPDGNVTLIDFGTAREFKEKNLADTSCLGTVGYAAPEQFGGMGQTDARTDIYCLGATLYHLVTGMNPSEPPYEIKPIREINSSLSGGLERIIQKCTQRDPMDRYQSAAELMYALEHYNEIDEQYRKKQKRKLGAFVATTAVACALAATSGWAWFAAEGKKAENYDVILRNASSTEDYFDAILTDPTRSDAYLELNQMLSSDYVLTKEEGQQLLRLQAGLDYKNASGFSESVDVLARLREADPTRHEEVLFSTGWNFLSYYVSDTDRDRYMYAAKWFQEIKDNASERGKIASLFYEIYECTNTINHLRGGKVIQTQALTAQRQKLWEEIVELMQRAGDTQVDFKLQIWIEVNNLINTNISDLLEVTTAEELNAVEHEIESALSDIQEKSPEITELIEQLRDSVHVTLERIKSAK